MSRGADDSGPDVRYPARCTLQAQARQRCHTHRGSDRALARGPAETAGPALVGRKPRPTHASGCGLGRRLRGGGFCVFAGALQLPFSVFLGAAFALAAGGARILRASHSGRVSSRGFPACPQEFVRAWRFVPENCTRQAEWLRPAVRNSPRRGALRSWARRASRAGWLAGEPRLRPAFAPWGAVFRRFS